MPRSAPTATWWLSTCTPVRCRTEQVSSRLPTWRPDVWVVPRTGAAYAVSGTADGGRYRLQPGSVSIGREERRLTGVPPPGRWPWAGEQMPGGGRPADTQPPFGPANIRRSRLRLCETIRTSIRTYAAGLPVLADRPGHPAGTTALHHRFISASGAGVFHSMPALMRSAPTNNPAAWDLRRGYRGSTQRA